MTRQIISTSERHAFHRRTQRPAAWIVIPVVVAIVSLGCNLSSNSAKPSNSVNPGNPTKLGKPLKFEKTDCSLPGISFDNITVNYVVDDTYDGPYLICSSSSQGSHGSVTSYYSVMAYKADKLDAAYNDMQANIQGAVDQSNQWNADPTVPADMKDDINFIQKSVDKYVVVISSVANVQNCYQGNGYGVEKYLDKYLIHLNFASCELGDADAYRALLLSLESAAYAAIYRIEGISIP